MSAFPDLCDIREIENTWITLEDGCRLAARIWLPEDAEERPVPAILEYLPYRKRDGTAVRDALTHPWFAQHGYACVRVDMRGSGESVGVLLDEYTRQEQDDALEVIGWLTRQSWCTGAVGMMGISWGGFNGLQVAARKPAALRAVVTLCSTVDRYADDIHYKGGCVLGENLGWSATMLSYMSRPPDPALVGDRWRSMWLERLEAQPHLAEIWHEHRNRDSYWKHGSICEDWSAIECPVLAVGGWGDAYKNAVPQLVENLKHVCCKGIIGPWVHKYPHFAVPEPRIDFLGTARRWWDRWLRGIDNSVENDPDYRVYCQKGGPPRTSYQHRPGRWLSEPVWPSPDVTPTRLWLTGGGLAESAGDAIERPLRSPENTGTMAGEYCAIWLGPDLPGDQRSDDAFSLTIDGPALEEPVVLLGAPRVHLHLTADRPHAQIAVRLNAINLDGSVERITYGVLDLARCNDPEHPNPLSPGEPVQATLDLDHCCHELLVGQRLRISISTAYWPLIWPSPEAVTLRLILGPSWIDLPIRHDRGQPVPQFAEAVSAPPAPRRTLRQPSHQRNIRHTLATGTTTLETRDDFGEAEDLGNGLITGSVARERWQIHPDDPTSAEAQIHWTQTLSRGTWNIRTEARCQMRADQTSFHIEGEVEAFENEEQVHLKRWSKAIPRG